MMRASSNLKTSHIRYKERGRYVVRQDARAPGLFPAYFSRAALILGWAWPRFGIRI